MNRVRDLELAAKELALLRSILPGGDRWAEVSDDLDCLERCPSYRKGTCNGPNDICSEDWDKANLTPAVFRVIVHTLQNYDHYDQGDYGNGKSNLAAKLAVKFEVAMKSFDDSEFSDGDQKLGVHFFRERNSTEISKIKNEALKNKSMVCEACKVDYFPIFGREASRIVECHHSVPLSSAKHRGKTKRSDLKLLCATCHRIAHTQNEPLTVSKVRTVLRRLADA